MIIPWCYDWLYYNLKPSSGIIIIDAVQCILIRTYMRGYIFVGCVCGKGRNLARWCTSVCSTFCGCFRGKLKEWKSGLGFIISHFLWILSFSLPAIFRSLANCAAHPYTTIIVLKGNPLHLSLFQNSNPKSHYTLGLIKSRHPTQPPPLHASCATHPHPFQHNAELTEKTLTFIIIIIIICNTNIYISITSSSSLFHPLMNSTAA